MEKLSKASWMGAIWVRLQWQAGILQAGVGCEEVDIQLQKGLSVVGRSRKSARDWKVHPSLLECARLSGSKGAQRLGRVETNKPRSCISFVEWSSLRIMMMSFPSEDYNWKSEKWCVNSHLGDDKAIQGKDWTPLESETECKPSVPVLRQTLLWLEGHVLCGIPCS